MTEPCLPELIRLDAALQIAPPGDRSGNQPRRFTMSAYDGGLLRLPNFPVPVVIDLAGMQPVDQVKALLHHDPARPVGHMDRVSIATDIQAEGVLSVPEHAAEITAAHQNGFEWEASVGATIERGALERLEAGRQIQVNGRRFTGPLAVARRTRLREISFTGAGAGENTSAALAASRAIPFTLDDEPMPEPASKPETSADNPTETKPTQAPETKPAPSPAPSQAADKPASEPASDVQAEIREIQASMRSELDALKQERQALQRERLAESVDRIAAQYNCTDTEITASLRQKAESGEIAETEIELEILRASRGRGVAGLQPVGQAQDGPAASHVIEASICLTNGWAEEELGKHFDEKTVNEAINAKYSGFGVRGLMVEYLNSRGHHVLGGRLTDDDIKAAIGYADREQPIQASGGFSTLSLPGITSNVARKEVLRGYDSFRQAILRIARIGSTTDYKPFYMYRLNTAGLLEQVGADGELKSIELTEDEYQSRVYPFGRKLAITDVMWRNDDASAFSDLARLFGITAARTVEKTGFTTLLSTVSTFWTTADGNALAAGAGSALDIDSLGSAYQLFLQMNDSTGQPIGIDPRYLLTAPADAVAARNINQSTTTNLALAGSTDAVSELPNRNPFVGMFEPLHSPYLASGVVPNANGTQWLLCGDPGITSPIAAAFLDGMRTPRIRPWEALAGRLGMQWDVSINFGFNLHDSRASVYSPGQ